MQINEKSVWQLCLEIAVDMEVLSSLPTTTRAKAEKIKAHLDAYLEAATPPDVAKIARSLEALAEHLSDQPLTHADSTDLATIRKAATALRLSAGGGTTTARTLDEWHEDYSDAVWWTWQDGEWLGEPSYIGTPNDSDWPGYHTHWTPHPDFPAPPTVEAVHVE